MSLRRPPRLPKPFYLGPQRIFLTMCTFERRPHFTSDGRVDLVRREFLRTTHICDVEATAYCFMPDHLHALLIGRSESCEIDTCITKFRQLSSYRHRQQHKERLWQEGYFDRSLRDEEDTLAIAPYILGNPVRAGLCQDPLAYPYSGSSRYTLREIAESVQTLG